MRAINEANEEYLTRSVILRVFKSDLPETLRDSEFQVHFLSSKLTHRQTPSKATILYSDKGAGCRDPWSVGDDVIQYLIYGKLPGGVSFP
jgi:hypothetical protein